jgi:hypothetical protein
MARQVYRVMEEAQDINRVPVRRLADAKHQEHVQRDAGRP